MKSNLDLNQKVGADFFNALLTIPSPLAEFLRIADTNKKQLLYSYLHNVIGEHEHVASQLAEIVCKVQYIAGQAVLQSADTGVRSERTQQLVEDAAVLVDFLVDFIKFCCVDGLPPLLQLAMEPKPTFDSLERIKNCWLDEKFSFSLSHVKQFRERIYMIAYEFPFTAAFFVPAVQILALMPGTGTLHHLELLKWHIDELKVTYAHEDVQLQLEALQSAELAMNDTEKRS